MKSVQKSKLCDNRALMESDRVDPIEAEKLLGVSCRGIIDEDKEEQLVNQAEDAAATDANASGTNLH